MHTCCVRLGLACFLIRASLSSLLTQTPGSVEVQDGGTVTLTCSYHEVMTHCNAITWVKIDQMTGEVRTGTRIRPISNKQKEACTGTISEVTSKDAGMYYCLALHSSVSYFGNGSKVSVTESTTASPTIQILSPSEDINSSSDAAVHLICTVSGADHLNARLHWMISGERQDGWTESLWLSERISVRELIQNHITIPSWKWKGGANCTCVVEYPGKTVHETVQRNDSRRKACYSTVWLYRLWGLSVSLLILVLLSLLAGCSGKYFRSGP